MKRSKLTRRSWRSLGKSKPLEGRGPGADPSGVLSTWSSLHLHQMAARAILRRRW